MTTKVQPVKSVGDDFDYYLCKTSYPDTGRLINAPVKPTEMMEPLTSAVTYDSKGRIQLDQPGNLLAKL